MRATEQGLGVSDHYGIGADGIGAIGADVAGTTTSLKPGMFGLT